MIKQSFKGISLSVITTTLINFIASLSISFISLTNLGEKEPIFFQLVSMALAYFIILSYIWVLLRKQELFKDIIKIKKLKLNKVIYAILIALVIIVTTALIAGFLYPSEGISGNTTTQKLTIYNGSFPFFVSFLFPTIIAPILEELCYRGLFGWFFDVFSHKKKFISILYVIVTSLIFGYLHLQSTGDFYSILSSFLFPFISGLVFSIQYLKTENILYPIITHSMYNTIIVLVSI